MRASAFSTFGSLESTQRIWTSAMETGWLGFMNVLRAKTPLARRRLLVMPDM
jgi:hypothetical protein